MDQSLIKAYSAITYASELLEQAPKALQGSKKEAIEQEAALYKKRIASSQQAYQQTVAMYKNKFGMPPAFRGECDELAIHSAEKDFNDTALRSLLFAPQNGLFAKKPKEADYYRFCRSALVLSSYYSKKLSQMEAYLEALQFSQPQQLKQLQLGVANAKANSEPSAGNWETYPSNGTSSKELYLGDLEIPVEDMGLTGLWEIGVMDGRQGESWLELPFSYHAHRPFSLAISYEGDTKEGAVKLGNLIRSLMYQIMHSLPPYSYEFVYLDPTHSGSTLKEINAKLASAIDGNAFRLHEELYPDHQYKMLTIGTNKEETQDLLKKLEARIGRVNSICGGKSVVEYNAPQFDDDGSIKDGCVGVIPQTFVFFENVHGVLDQNTVQILHKLADCADASGISLLVTSLREKDEKFTPEEQDLLSQDKNRDGLDQIQWDPDGCSIYFDGDIMGQDKDKHLFYNFAPYYEPASHEEYLNLVSASFRPSLDTETRYEKRVDIDQRWGSGNADVEITIPVGVNQRNQVVTISVGGPDGAHALLAGSTGCGKSSYLHTIINGVIINYKPTDVQLWLSDYKTAEFRRYMRNTPPHITYVGIARSVEYTLNFLDRIYKEYERRLKVFDGLTSVAEYRKVHGPDSMPRILIVVDEFHVMSNHVKEFPEYKMKLADLLREARAMGITFLLADQTCGVGLQGLSEDGKLQLTCRMSMVTTNEEYNAVFNITNAKDVIPVLQRFEVVLARTISRINSKGVAENSRYYEQCKTLFTSPDLRSEIAQKSIETYGPAEDPLFIEEFQRTAADWNLIAEEESKSLIRRGIPIYLGTPLSMQKTFGFRMMTNNNENAVSLVPFDEIQASILISQLESVRRQNNSEIYIAANPNDFLFAYCESWLEKLALQDRRVHVVSEIEDICATVLRLCDTMEMRRKQRSFDSQIHVFWIDLYDIAEDMSYLSSKRPGRNVSQSGASQSLFDRLKELDAQFDALFDDNDAPSTIADIPGEAESSDASGEENGMAYNAAEDIKQLMSQGPRRDIHNFVFYSAFSVAKQTKCAPLDKFTHKIALGIGKDDALDFFGAPRLMNNAEGKPLDDNTAVYYNGRVSTQFMPFISDLEVKIREQTGL